MNNKGYKAIKFLILAFLLVSVVFPLVNLLLRIRWEDITAVCSSPQFGDMIKNSLLTTLTATFLSVGLAMLLAWCINRTNIRFRAIFSILFTLPMLIPSISHGMGLVLLFGDNGLVTNLLGINIQLFGFCGIVIGSMLYSFPVAFLMLTDIFQYEDYTVYETAQVLGLSNL